MMENASDSELKEIAYRLQEAISSGNEKVAKDLVSRLSSSHLNLNINVSQEQNSQQSLEKEFSVKVQVEDRVSSGSYFELFVRSTDTIEDLKRKVWLEHRFPYEVQRWIIAKRIPDDNVPLWKCGISGPGYTLYLYIVTARSVGLNQQSLTRSGNEKFENVSSGHLLSNNLSFEERGQDVSMLLMNGMENLPPLQGQNPSAIPPPLPPRQPTQVDDDRDETKVVKLSPGSLMDYVLRPALSEEEQKPKRPGWTCSLCTFYNLPTRPGCEICSSDRPEDYQVPDDYRMTDDELAFAANQEEVERMTRQNHELALRTNFNEWLELDNLDLIPNTVAFTCPICFEEFEQGEGIVLRDCLHMFCKECLEAAITHSEEPSLTCPFQDDEVTCDSILQEREIRALVPEETFIKYLQRSLDQAESQAANSFHCKTANCNGWCVYEDEVNFFPCPICGKRNCLTCKVIHEGMDCKEYQADLANKAKNNDAAKKTQELIEEMVKNGTAMLCPMCKIIVQKKDGCDWIKCSVCKTEICWVTKGPRWGPKGPGDNTGGCRCGVNGRCHPSCGNCH